MIKLIPKGEEQSEMIAYTAQDIDDLRTTLHVNDEVEFNLIVEKRTGKKHASHITLIKAAPEVRLHGVISDVKKNYGYISCLEQEEEIYFYFEDFEEKTKNILPGLELDFVIARSGKDKKKATRIRILPPGSVKFEVEFI
jgi:cold shock CspA family protein